MRRVQALRISLLCSSGFHRDPDDILPSLAPASAGRRGLGITLSVEVAQQRLHEAVKLARSGQPLPEEWLERVVKVGAGPRKIDIAILAAGLLAKATDARVNPLIIKIEEDERAYSARVMADGVLAPAALVYGLDLGSNSPNPINSSTFLRPPSIDQVVGVRHRPSLAYLQDTLRRLDELDAPSALEALAAFVRVRMEVAARRQPVDPPTGTLSLPGMLEAITTFINTDRQRGARGQAFVAAAYDLVFEHVRTRKVHDPSRHWPGDVQILRGDSLVLAVEVKQRPVSKEDVLRFAAELAGREVDRGAYAALDPAQPLMPSAVLDQVWERHQVLLTWMDGPAAVLLAALAWSPHRLKRSLAEFPKRMLLRLEDVEAGEHAQKAWVALFSETTLPAHETAQERLFEDVE